MRLPYESQISRQRKRKDAASRVRVMGVATVARKFKRSLRWVYGAMRENNVPRRAYWTPKKGLPCPTP